MSILAPNHHSHIRPDAGDRQTRFHLCTAELRASALTEQEAIVRYLEPTLVCCSTSRSSRLLDFSGTTLSLTDYEAWGADNGNVEAPPKPDLSPEDTQMILLTGGTTGTPKGAMRSVPAGFCKRRQHGALVGPA